MSVDTTLAVLYAQSGLSTNVANAAMVAPQASLAMTRVLAAEAARQERDQVAKSEKTAEGKIHKDGDDRRQPQGRLRRRRRQQPVQEAEVLFTTPVIGNLLNVKV